MAVTFHGHQQSFGQNFNHLLHCDNFVEDGVKSIVFSGLSLEEIQCSGDKGTCSGFLSGEEERIQFSREGSIESTGTRKSQNVCGSDIGDFPTKYVVKDLHAEEFPVIGTYIDGNILPGFKYLIRLLGSRKYLFDEQPLTLLSIGMGYGKRITMEGDKDNYFYSDTYSDGCGFQIVAVSQGDRFIITDSCDFPIGKAVVDLVQSQKELSSEINSSTGAVEKIVNVSFTCSVSYSSEPHGLLPLCSNRYMQITAPVFLEKPKHSSKACVTVIKDIHLQRYGACSFQPCI